MRAPGAMALQVGAVAAAMAVSLTVSGALWLPVQLVAAAVVMALLLPGACLVSRLSRGGSADSGALAFIMAAVAADAFTTGYGLGAGLEERGPVASLAVRLLGEKAAFLYFVAFEPLAVIVSYLVLSGLLAAAASARSGARQPGPGLACARGVLLAALTLGPAAAAVSNAALAP